MYEVRPRPESCVHRCENKRPQRGHGRSQPRANRPVGRWWSGVRWFFGLIRPAAAPLGPLEFFEALNWKFCFQAYANWLTVQTRQVHHDDHQVLLHAQDAQPTPLHTGQPKLRALLCILLWGSREHQDDATAGWHIGPMPPRLFRTRVNTDFEI